MGWSHSACAIMDSSCDECHVDQKHVAACHASHNHYIALCHIWGYTGCEALAAAVAKAAVLELKQSLGR